MPSQTGKKVSELKREIADFIMANKSSRMMYVHIYKGLSFAENIDNDEYVIGDSSDVSLTITCVHGSGYYAHIEFTSYAGQIPPAKLEEGGIISRFQ